MLLTPSFFVCKIIFLENIHEHLDLALNLSHKLNIFLCMYVTKIYKNVLVTNAYGLHV